MLQAESWATFALSFRRVRHHRTKKSESTNALRRKKSNSMPSLVAAAAAAAAFASDFSPPAVIVEEDSEDFDINNKRMKERRSTQMYNGGILSNYLGMPVNDGRRSNSIGEFEMFYSTVTAENQCERPNGLLGPNSKSRGEHSKDVNWNDNEAHPIKNEARGVARLSLASIVPLIAAASDSAAVGLLGSPKQQPQEQQQVS